MSSPAALRDQNAKGSWEIFRPLLESDELKAVPCIKNRPGEVHRVSLTGFDRPGVPCVRGRLFQVIHGVMGGKSNNTTPATLIVFEWEFNPTCSHRFRQVDIEVIFEAVKGSSGPGELPDRDDASYTPQVVKLSPKDAVRSFKSNAQVISDWTPEFRISFGFPPYLAFTPGISHKTSNTTTRTYCRFIAGASAFEGHESGAPNAVTWTLFENSSQQSGVQNLVRTAVLVVRPRNSYRPFIATVKTKARVGIWHSLGETFKDLFGLVPVDDPVYFDPGPIKDHNGVVHKGAVVVDGTKVESNGGESPCDVDNLGSEDLERFMIKDEEWAVQEPPTSVRLPHR